MIIFSHPLYSLANNTRPPGPNHVEVLMDI
ncbi:hypothetical protein NC652_007776 [Populus alba x Populus x berolinensis]|nr:hypothetical protein NC652_007776 [Populus alba x Populus x berolinensis]